MILSAAPELRSGPDGEVRYVPDSSFYWLTGYTEPDAVLVLCPSCEEGSFILFVRPRDPEREVWTGPRGGVEAAQDVYGADVAWPVAELKQRLHVLAHVSALYARVDGVRPDVDGEILAVLNAGRHGRARTGAGPHMLIDPGVLLDDMRLVKDATEIARIREAARISVEAFHDAAVRIAPGAGEWQVEAALDGGFRARGAFGPAFPTIVAGGTNATVLHYTANDATLAAGQLVLVDAGARAGMYCADISRTFPASGRFTPDQRDLYDAVLGAHAAAIAAVCPGNTIEHVFDAALHALLDALIWFRFVEGPRDRLLEDPASYRRFCPHRSSHWLGLDVHDVGSYRMKGGEPRRLVAGMVLTIEPGLYVPSDAPGPATLAGTGIRIEDDVLVTDEGHDVLTAALAVAATAIEALMD
jgi:Xaa-Pro aminopeptidase